MVRDVLQRDTRRWPICGRLTQQPRRIHVLVHPVCPRCAAGMRRASMSRKVEGIGCDRLKKSG